MNMYRNTVRNASMIVLSAGLAASTLAQYDNEQRKNDRQQTMTSQPEQRQARGQEVASLSMHRASDLIGSEIRNTNSDDGLGNLDDLIVDRGSGKISHIVVQSGDILGLGGERVAIPFEVFTYDPIDRSFTLAMTNDELDNVSEVTPKDWIVLNSGDLEAQLRSIGESTRKQAHDMFANTFGSDVEAETIEGNVQSVNRWNDNNGNEYISVEIATNNADGETRTVVLGPSWYVLGSESAPMVNHDTTIQAVPMGDSDNRYVATSMGSDSNRTSLRNTDGSPAWDSQGAQSSAVMLNDLLGRDANARTDKGGEIQDVLIEANSGMVPVIVFDPNENVLGLGDELYCVPWSQAHVWPDVVRIDASMDTLATCERLPDDLESLTTKDSIRHIYKPFDAEVTRFTVREHKQWHSDLRKTKDTNRGG